MADVLIAGAGPAGLAAAIALAERGVPTMVVDPTGGTIVQRGELLVEGASEITRRLGLGEVLDEAVRITDVVSQWGAAHAHGGAPGLGLHGWGVDRHRLSQGMLRRCDAVGVSVRAAKINSHRRTGRKWEIGLSDNDAFATRFLIDATGRPAHIARRHGATSLHGDDLVAVVWRASRQTTSDMVSEAARDGWWYAVPYLGGRSVGFVTSAETAKKICRNPEAFLAASADDLSLLSLEGLRPEPWMMDSRSALLDKMTGDGWLATGDAAVSFDPIASQGLFNAMSGGFFAGNAAADALAGDGDAPLVYEALAQRTAEQTHGMTHLQYAALPFDTFFWRTRAQQKSRTDLNVLRNACVTG